MMKTVNMIDMDGHIVGEIELSGEVPESDPLYDLFQGIDTDKSFTIQLGDKTWVGIQLKSRVIN